MDSENVDALRIVVRDDGPGVPQAQLANLGQRGLRLDEFIPGSGLGLAIADDITEGYGGDMAFANGVEGGLTITLLLPISPAN